MSSCPRIFENMEVYSLRKEGEPPFQEKALVFVPCKSCIAHLWRWKWTEIPREIFSKNMQKSEFSTSPQIWCLARLQAPGFQGVQISVDREPLTLARWKSLIPPLSKRCARSQMNPPRIWNPVEACGGIWRHGKMIKNVFTTAIWVIQFCMVQEVQDLDQLQRQSFVTWVWNTWDAEPKSWKEWKDGRKALRTLDKHDKLNSHLYGRRSELSDTFGIGASFGLKPLVKTRIVRLCISLHGQFKVPVSYA